MRLEFTGKFQKDNEGIKELLQILTPNGRMRIDFKKGSIYIENFPSDKINDIMSIIITNFEITEFSLNHEQVFKIRNDEKVLKNKKEKLKEKLNEKPSSIVSQIHNYIFETKVFSLTDIRTTFPKVNFGTIRSYVNNLKHENIIVEIERGKYAVR